MLDRIGGDRFRVVRALGRGGMGVVYEVYDQQQSTACALKLLPDVRPRALHRFKEEFRSLQGLRHPNLISLGELLSDGEQWFFTMELVRGVDFRTHTRGRSIDANEAVSEVRATHTMTIQDDAPLRTKTNEAVARSEAPAVHEPQLRSALAQLASGLEFLHASGTIHRDVKPSNVLVSETGRVVLLDFGLVERADATKDRAGDRRIEGTLGYMAPEQAREGNVGPPADLYAMGVMLYEALTGDRPFGDRSIADVLVRAGTPAPRPSAVMPNVARDLDDLCVQLLDPNPERRPTASEVLARLGTELGARVSPFLERQPLVGRDREIETLVAAYRESATRPTLVAIQAASGVGKTALIDAFADRLRRHDDRPLVLRGRCYEHEGIPYKAIDGVVDELAEHLACDPALTPETRASATHVGLLSMLFPVLGRVPGFGGKAAGSASRDFGNSPHEMRREAERALISLVARTSMRRPIVVVIDDFQWADSDSSTLLAALARAPSGARILLVVTSREQVALTFDARDVRLSLAPLAKDDARVLAERLLGADAADAVAVADAIAEEAGGHPLFLHELALRASRTDRTRAVEGARLRLDDVLWDRVDALPDAARRVLELVAVSSAPVAQSIVAEVANLDVATFARVAQELRAERLIRTTGIRPLDDVEAYHDRIRETIVGRLPKPARAAHHRGLAQAMERAPEENLDALVMHCEGAGEGAKAGAYAIRAGDAARDALAFERAASFYRQAIAHLPETELRAKRVRRELAQSLAGAGLAADAAIEFEKAAKEAEGAESIDLDRKAAEHWLASGRLKEGTTAIDAVLERVGVRAPKTMPGTIASLAARVLWVRVRGVKYVERSASDIDPNDILRADALWAAAARLSPIDPVRAADYQLRHLLHCLELGEPFYVARAIMLEATFNAMNGPSTWARTQRLLADAKAITSRIDVPYATAMATFTEGFAEFQCGRYARAHRLLQSATDLLRTAGASHDVAVSSRFAIDCLFHLGDLTAMRLELPRLLEDAERRGDLYFAAELRTGTPSLVWLCADQPEEARRMVATSIAGWLQRSFYLQHYYHLLASAQIALYMEEGQEAHRLVEGAWSALRRSLLMTVQIIRTEAWFLRARAAIAVGGRKAWRIASRAERVLATHRIPVARGAVLAIRAARARSEGATAEAIALLRDAARAFADADMRMVEAACRFHAAGLAGDARARTEAEAWIVEHGVVRADRFAAMLIPGF